MLTIPEEIKELFRMDSIRKNFRIHFPDGERADITNAELISESVKFTESLCSQENIRFGLCEASVLEFETIGVGNIKGLTIEAGIEIDISSLGADFIAEHGQSRTDVPYPVFCVPYGRFTVDSCKRQSNMKRRKVVAYTNIISDKTPLSPAEKMKHGIRIADNVPYSFDAAKFVFSNIKNISPALFNEQEVVLQTNRHYGSMLESVWGGWKAETLVYYFKRGTEVPEEAFHALYRFTFDKADGYEESVESIKNALYQPQWNVGNMYNTWDGTAPWTAPRFVVSPGYKSNTWGKSTKITEDYMLYPYVSGLSENDEGYIEIPVSFTFQKTFLIDSPDDVHIKLSTGAHLYRMTEKSGKLCSITMQMERKAEKMEGLIIAGMPDTYYHADSADWPLHGMVSAFLEINGLFYRENRYGASELVRICNNFGLYPSEDLYPDPELFPNEANGGIVSTYHYESLWYEEYEVQPFGRIAVTCKDKDGNEKTFSYTFDRKSKNIYDFKDNFIFRNTVFTEEELKQLLDTYFIPNIKGISYTPADIKMKGLPFVEAGDVLNVLTRDGGFETFVFRRTISGIQSLSDDVEARGDEVNEDMTDKSVKAEGS